ncbi:MAG: glycosyltransferase family 2 protein [Marinosulfonomonas sp.]|nr:glycosyltransferase family 2 protein [Marinosulfonomonas sp.]
MRKLSVIITAHDEGILLGPTIRSVEAAISAAENAGFGVERLIGLDAPTQATIDFCENEMLAAWKIHTFDFRNPFLVRNAMAEIANANWIGFVDGDDLVSENWFKKALEFFTDTDFDGSLVVVHPELNVIFGNQTGTFVKPDQSSPLFLSQTLYYDNYYDMMAVCSKELLLEYPYAPRDLKGGYGYQDWQWNIETLAAGVRHVVLKDTIIFKRRRRNSVSEQNRSHSSVVRYVAKAMAVDKVAKLGRS